MSFSTEELNDILAIERDYDEFMKELKEEFDDPENGHRYGRGDDYELCWQQEYDRYQEQLASIDSRLVIG